MFLQICGVLLLLLQLYQPVPAASNTSTESIYVPEFFSQNAQRLSFYSWYGNVRLYRFQVPPDTVLLRWLLQASMGNGPECQETDITVSFRYGAPPVINPLDTAFSKNTTFRPPYMMAMKLRRNLHNNTFVNVTNPAPGDWFIAVHLPKDDEKIAIKGLSSLCAYTFQPDLFLLRVVNVAIFEPDTWMANKITSPTKPVFLKIFIPEYTKQLTLVVRNCTANNVGGLCPVKVTVGSVTTPQAHKKTMECTNGKKCIMRLDSPPWEAWLPITLMSVGDQNRTVSLEILASFTECKPSTAHSGTFTFNRQLNLTLNTTTLWKGIAMPTPNASAINFTAFADRTLDMDSNVCLNESSDGYCLRNLPVIRKDLDVVSIQFHAINGPFVSIPAEFPIVLPLNLNSGIDNGGMLTVHLLLNKTTLPSADARVYGCLSVHSPVLFLNGSENCTTSFFQGYPFDLSASFTESTRGIPFPETGNWYLSMQVICPQNQSVCSKVKTKVMVSISLEPCLKDCGPYGECRLLRRHGYLYAACSCKSGWAGWSCTDAANAISILRQVLATLLLTLSNLMFLPAIVVAFARCYYVEASVYTFTMFFSTFYHACDQPGVAVMCIMDYDTLQFCDFFGSVVSIWVTLLCMSRLRNTLKYVLFILGALLIAMSVQLDRRGIWNMLGPCLFAVTVLVTAWIYRGAKRRHCYPPSWKRWAFFLLPGALLVLVALSVFAFLETTKNYFYTHSLWHIMVASSVALLLPPREKNKKPWAWSRYCDCNYDICLDEQEELYVVT